MRRLFAASLLLALALVRVQCHIGEEIPQQHARALDPDAGGQ